jgi:hypothetical protein
VIALFAIYRVSSTDGNLSQTGWLENPEKDPIYSTAKYTSQEILLTARKTSKLKNDTHIRGFFLSRVTVIASSDLGRLLFLDRPKDSGS